MIHTLPNEQQFFIYQYVEKTPAPRLHAGDTTGPTVPFAMTGYSPWQSCPAPLRKSGKSCLSWLRNGNTGTKSARGSITNRNRSPHNEHHQVEETENGRNASCIQ